MKILLIVLLPFIVLSQTQICDEDFEGVTPGEIPRYDPTGSGEISECARTLYTHEGLAPADTGEFLASGGNPGQCAQAYLGPNISGYGYSEPKWRFDNTIGGSSTIYIKFDLKIDANLGTSNGTREITDFKVIRITDHTDASTASSNEWHPQLQAEPSHSEIDSILIGIGDTNVVALMNWSMHINDSDTLVVADDTLKIDIPDTLITQYSTTDTAYVAALSEQPHGVPLVTSALFSICHA